MFDDKEYPNLRNKTIYKYSLECPNRLGEIRMDLHRGTQPLYVGIMGRENYMWALVAPQNELVRKIVYCVGTGHEVPHLATYIGTIVEPSLFVWHYFWYPFDENDNEKEDLV